MPDSRLRHLAVRCRRALAVGAQRDDFAYGILLEGVVMEYAGTVQNGVIVVDSTEPLPEGARVRIVLEEGEKPTLVGLLKYAGILPDMPADFAEQHDHYIHGTPKR
jgi:hypothetical protein